MIADTYYRIQRIKALSCGTFECFQSPVPSVVRFWHKNTRLTQTTGIIDTIQFRENVSRNHLGIRYFPKQILMRAFISLYIKVTYG